MSEQRPIGSGFGAASTAAEVLQGLDLSGRTAVITGGYSGLGLAGAKAMADAGAEVIVPARDRAKAIAAIDDPRIRVESLDLMDPAAIDAFAERFLSLGKPLNFLINSAGIMAAPLARDARGYESHFSTNHLGHFQLTCRLWPALKQAGGARVVAVSSLAHAHAPVNLEDPNWNHREYERWQAYSESKSANVLFALELDRRGEGDRVRAFSCHPGAIITNLGRHTSDEEMRSFGMIDEQGRPIVDPATGRKTPEQGAATQTWCATNPKLHGLGGVYCEDCEIASPIANDAPAGKGVRRWAIDSDAARRLWAISEALTGVALA
jgi:NAD(P)-dependent dehydrogenase (short-subunit alcohol dehydrogenase family)